MSLYRIPFTLSAAVAMNIAGTPPNSPPEETEKVRPTLSERLFAKTMAPRIVKVSNVILVEYMILTDCSSSDLLLDVDLS